MKFSKDIELVIRCVASCGDINRQSFIRRWNSLTSGGDYSWASLDGIESFIVSLEKKLKKKIPVGELTRRGIVVKKPIKDHGADYDYPIFITYEMLIRNSMDLLNKIPEIKGVLGCPRSGMISASSIANALSIPLYSLSGGDMIKLHSSRSENGGSRMRMYEENSDLPILVIDDSVFSGTEMTFTKNLLKEKHPEQEFIYAAIFSLPQSIRHVDYHCKTLSYPHIFEWNIFDADPSKRGVLDMDGVLCEEIPHEIAEDEEAYGEYIKDVEPIHGNLPVLFGCRAICTGRLEKYRKTTEDWLSRHKVKYKELIMFPGTKEERDRNHHEVVGKYKADNFSKVKDARFFIESSDLQSKIIAGHMKNRNLSSYLVICPGSGKVY
jgi:orotate phosphoribosyltransferase